MSTYVKDGKPLEFDNAPDWLVAHMRYRRTVLGNTNNAVITYFMGLREFFQWWACVYETGRQPQSAKALREVDILLLPIEAALAVKKADVESYLYFLVDVLGNAVVTRNKKLVTIRGFYEYLIESQEALGIDIEVNPADRIRSPKLPKKQPIYLPEKDRKAFLDAVAGKTTVEEAVSIGDSADETEIVVTELEQPGENSVRDYAMFLLLLSAGLRESELVGINMGDLNVDTREIRIRGKGNKERTAHLTDACCEAIQRYIDEYRNGIQGLDTKALFVSRRYRQRLTTRSIQKTMRKYTLEAKLGGKGYTPHKLRHTTATMLAKDGKDSQVIQKVLGHESMDTTQIYMHLDSSDIAKAVDTSSLNNLGAD